MIYWHNVNFVGFVYCLHYLCYISSQSPTFSDQGGGVSQGPGGALVGEFAAGTL